MAHVNMIPGSSARPSGVSHPGRLPSGRPVSDATTRKGCYNRTGFPDMPSLGARLAPFLVVIVCSAACRRTEAPAGSRSPPAETHSPLEPAPGAPSGTVPTNEPAPTGALAESPALVDLVHRTTSLVVSSSHRDANSRVEFLVDDLSESAWRPNPPDPAPWVELQFAHEAEVHTASIETGSGSDSALELHSPELGTATYANGYTFRPAAPVRARKVRFEIRGGKTKEPSKALALAELRVRGRVAPEFVREYALPEGRAQRSAPYARIDRAEFRRWWREAPYQSQDELCRAYETAMGLPKVEEIPGGRKFAFCHVPDEALPVDGTPPPNVRTVRSGFIAIDPSDDYSGESVTLLFVETDAGWSPANLWSDTDAYDGTCPGMHVAQSAVERTFWDGALLSQERGRLYYPPSGMYFGERASAPSALRSLLRCDTTERLSCREHVLAYGTPRIEYDEISRPVPVIPDTWTWTRSLSTGDDGWVRLSPCRNEAANVVPCFAPAEPRLP